MTVVRVKGVKRYRSKGRWSCFHRATGTRLNAEFGTGEFFAELATLERKVKREKAAPGTLGMLLASYRFSPTFEDLAASTQRGYLGMMNILQPLHEMPLVELTSPFIASLRDKLAAKRGRRTANFVMAVVSVACEHGKEQGLIAQNPVKGVRACSASARAAQGKSTMSARRMSRRLGAFARSTHFAGRPRHVHRPKAGRHSEPKEECSPGWPHLACDGQDWAGSVAAGPSGPGQNPCRSERP